MATAWRRLAALGGPWREAARAASWCEARVTAAGLTMDPYAGQRLADLVLTGVDSELVAPFVPNSTHVGAQHTSTTRKVSRVPL